MKQEIKERIEKIKKGIVPEGYKKTKLGIIPIVWKTKFLNEISIIKGQYGINAPACDYSANLPTYLRITDISDNGHIDKSDLKSVKSQNYKDYVLEKNDIVFARTGNTVGKTYLYNSNDGKLVFAGYLIRFKIDNNLASSKFVKFFTETSSYWRWVKIMSSRSGQPGINSLEFGKLLLPYPERNEQELIANILSTWDNAIELKEKLIEQKKKQKIGLMQLLLTGKKRLKGFTRQWKKVKLKEVGEIYQPETISNDMFTKVGYPVYGANGQIGFYDKYNHENWQILITCRGSTCGTVNKSEPKSWITGNAMVLNTDNNPNVNKNYIYYCCKNSNFNRIITGSGQPQITREPLANYTITIPVDIFEQEAIVNILLMAEKYIELLEQELEQIKRQKKGLMQLLLTGIVRVTD